MTNRNKILSACLMAIIVVATMFAFTIPSKKSDLLLNTILRGINNNHYEPIEIDDDFSARVFNAYIERLDRNKRFFTEKDINKFQKHRTLIDNYIVKKEYGFFDETVSVLEARIDEARGFYQEILAQAFDFDKEENIELDSDKLSYAANKKEMREKWRKSLKYQTLTRLTDMIEKQEKAKEEGDKEFEYRSIEEMEKDAREKVLKNHDNWFKRLDKMKESDRLSTYLNAITAAYDPHTNYFPPKDKEDFDINLSGRLEGIGATLSEKDGYIEVVRIVPGSPSWKQGELKSDDIILKVAQGDEEPVDITEMRLDEAVQLIRGKKGTEVRLTVKKPDGITKIIPIIRDVVVIEESYAKSTVIEHKELGTKTGYIKLPKFYADFRNKNGRSCAKDVKKELIKFQEENVNGVVLDLRDNGGGSLQEVVDMAGLFIEEGPIVQVKSRDDSPYIYEDEDKSIQYDGPLVILVNSFSASASEILSAAMQDYGRAVIVGSPATYGKGTVQRFIDLDRYAITADDNLKPLGSLKLTIQKFYRINGGTNQLKGVVPDIVLPDRYSYIETGEKEQDYAMPWDEIKPANYLRWISDNTADLSIIQQKSKARTSNNPTFQLIEESAQYLKKQRDNTSYTLCLEKYRKYEEELEATTEKFDDIEIDIDVLDVHTLQADLAVVESDTTKQASMKEMAEALEKDAYLLEAVHIVYDISNN